MLPCTRVCHFSKSVEAFNLEIGTSQAKAAHTIWTCQEQYCVLCCRSLGDALKQWRSHLAVAGDSATPQQETEEAAAEAAEEAAADDSNAGQGEYEYMAEGQGRAEGEQQALAPATEDQAKAIEALQQSGRPDEDGDDVTAAEAEADPQLDDSSDRLQAEQAMRSEASSGQVAASAQQELKTQHAQQQEDLNPSSAEGHPDDTVMGEAEEERTGLDDSYVSAQLQRASLSDGAADGLPDQDMILAEGGLSREAGQQLRQDIERQVKAASEGTLQLDSTEQSAAYGQEVCRHSKRGIDCVPLGGMLCLRPDHMCVSVVHYIWPDSATPACLGVASFCMDSSKAKGSQNLELLPCSCCDLFSAHITAQLRVTASTV